MLQERIEKYYGAINLPIVVTDEDRGLIRCCVTELVLASTTTHTWKNDITPVWMKLSDNPADTLLIELLDSTDTVVTAYPIGNISFSNEPYAYFAEIHWKDVLAISGQDCYKIQLTYSIGGLPPVTFIWGQYELKTYSITNAMGTARIRCVFNLNQAIEGINFTGSNVQGTLRFNGQIRKDKPVITRENLIYGSREIKPVVAELKPSWALKTDPYLDEMLLKFETLYLLSDNEMFISDHNAHTNSYQIFDVPVVLVSESTDREPLDPLSRVDILMCTFNDRKQNKRTYY